MPSSKQIFQVSFSFLPRPPFLRLLAIGSGITQHSGHTRKERCNTMRWSNSIMEKNTIHHFETVLVICSVHVNYDDCFNTLTHWVHTALHTSVDNHSIGNYVFQIIDTLFFFVDIADHLIQRAYFQRHNAPPESIIIHLIETKRITKLEPKNGWMPQHDNGKVNSLDMKIRTQFRIRNFKRSIYWSSCVWWQVQIFMLILIIQNGNRIDMKRIVIQFGHSLTSLAAEYKT